ncbi:MAG: sce7726 family protein [Bacteroidetes bacterium]|nr:sce7726 family protein [Bacteroidota bacterium]
MISVNKNSDSLRSLSEIFTTSNFNKVVRQKDYKLTEKKIRKHYSTVKINTTYKKVLGSLYLELESEYRSEYFYKNNLLNRYLLKQFSLSTTSVFNEFKIGNSIADFILLNGKARIFEIKTDLDGLAKLEKQLNDYKQFADLVYIVTSSKYIDKLVLDYSDSTIGVIEFTQRNTFKEHKKAESNSTFFNHLTLFKTLRKGEYLDIVNSYFGYIPDVPNTKIFKACFELISSIEVIEFQKLAFNKLKKRKIKCPDLLESKKTPFELKQICYTLDFSEHEYNLLYTFLNKTI